jgi:aminopeptidase N
MMEFFEKETGVPYPWAKYDQVCVNDFVAGGMENTSATTLTDTTLFPEATENIQSSDGLVAHELAHQWFGDLVTCKDWSHTWLNEGFATYCEALYTEHHEGHDAMLWDLYGQAGATLGSVNDTTPIVHRDFENPEAMFGYRSYQKGSWVLHMLRSQLGPELFRDCVNTYLKRHSHGNVVTEDLRRVVEESSGRSFDRFFDQWVFHGRFPDVQVNYAWDESTRKAKVSVQQTHKVDAAVMLFEFPLTIRFKGAFGKLDRTVKITKAAEDFEFPLESAPKQVRIDPEYTLLAKITFPIPNGCWRPSWQIMRIYRPDIGVGATVQAQRCPNRETSEIRAQ